MEFLAHYERLWRAANAHGVTARAGIIHLIPLLPEEWRSWARSIVPMHSGDNYWGDEYTSCGSFIAAIGTRYLIYDAPPPGPPPPLVVQPVLAPQDDPEPELDPAVYYSEPSSPVAQVVPHLPEFDPPGLAQNLPIHLPPASPRALPDYSTTTNGFVHPGEDLVTASDADSDVSANAGGDANDGAVADDEEEDPDEDDQAPADD